MTVRDKILEAIGDIDNISDERLVDLLLDAFAEQRKEIERLEGANAHERQQLHDAREQIAQERHKLRSDPLYCAAGEYFFDVNGRFFRIVVQGNRMQLLESIRGQGSLPWLDYMGQQLSRQDWENRK